MHRMIVANDTYLSRVIFMDGRKGGANCWDAMHRDVWVDIQAIVVDRFAWNDFNQREVFMDTDISQPRLQANLSIAML